MSNDVIRPHLTFYCMWVLLSIKETLTGNKFTDIPFLSMNIWQQQFTIIVAVNNNKKPN